MNVAHVSIALHVRLIATFSFCALLYVKSAIGHVFVHVAVVLKHDPLVHHCVSLILAYTTKLHGSCIVKLYVDVAENHCMIVHPQLHV